MSIEWFSKNLRGVVTLYETNITLNTVASTFFKNAYATLIGYNQDDDTLVIKNVSKEEVDNNIYNITDLHPIVLKPSYGRINGKNIIRNINKYKQLDFSNTTMHKYECFFDESKKSLVIDMKEEIN